LFGLTTWGCLSYPAPSPNLDLKSGASYFLRVVQHQAPRPKASLLLGALNTTLGTPYFAICHTSWHFWLQVIWKSFSHTTGRGKVLWTV
jgi:hypothetical protein